jgi:uncharacterized damage-inducible protein DinB
MTLSTDLQTLVDRYAAGPGALRAAVAGLTTDQLLKPVAPGRWSILGVVCHLADAEILYADRIKRVLAEDRPTMFALDPDQFMARLQESQRDLEEELALVESVRKHIARILRSASAADFDRVGIHSADGPLTLRTLLERIAGHIPHHLEFILKKRAALNA